jgi:hypothetical protein
MEGYIHRHTNTHREQDDIIHLLLFFQNNVNWLKIRHHTSRAAGWRSVHIKLKFSKINHKFVHVNIRMLKNIVIPRSSEVLGSKNIAPRILNFDTKSREVLNFISRRLYPGQKLPVPIWQEGRCAPKTVVKNDPCSTGNQDPFIQPTCYLLY